MGRRNGGFVNGSEHTLFILCTFSGSVLTKLQWRHLSETPIWIRTKTAPFLCLSCNLAA